MKRRKDAKNKTTWEDFEQRMGLKRTGGDKDGKRSTRNAPSDILVQRMSSTASGRLKNMNLLIQGILYPLVTMTNFPLTI